VLPPCGIESGDGLVTIDNRPIEEKRPLVGSKTVNDPLFMAEHKSGDEIERAFQVRQVPKISPYD
jgi:hypothetical protein